MRTGKALATSLLTFCGLLLAAGPAECAGKITGRAVDLQGRNINQAPFRLFLDNGNPPQSGRTQTDGSFDISIPDGTVTVILVFGGDVDGNGQQRTVTPFALKSGEEHNLVSVVRADTDPPSEMTYASYQPTAPCNYSPVECCPPLVYCCPPPRGLFHRRR